MNQYLFELGIFLFLFSYFGLVGYEIMLRIKGKGFDHDG